MPGALQRRRRRNGCNLENVGSRRSQGNICSAHIFYQGDILQCLSHWHNGVQALLSHSEPSAGSSLNSNTEPKTEVPEILV